MNFLIRGSEYLARHERFQLIGRDDELERLTSTLMRGRASSVILVGPGGVGCTSLCLGVQALKQRPDAPFDVVNKRLFWLDTNGLFALGDAAEITRAFHKVVDRLNRTTEAVLLVEDARDFLEAARSNGVPHLVNSLLAAVRGGKCQVVLEVKDEDLDAILKAHTDVRELFTVLTIDEPTGKALGDIVNAAASALGRHHGIAVDAAAAAAAIDLTTKYRATDGLNRAQPERSVTLLDRALASYRLAAHGANVSEDVRSQLDKFYHNQRAGEIAIAEIEDEIDRLERRNGEADQDIRALGNFELPEISRLRERMRTLQDEVDANKKRHAAMTAAINVELRLTRDQVLHEFARISGISASKLDQNEIEKLRALEAALGSRIFGQDDAIERVANGVKVSRLGRRTGRPLAYLFMGPSGVGKTETARAIAAALLDDEEALTRFDMSEYMEKHAVAKLIGAPPGYEGFDVGGVLTNLMRRSRYRVLLFDEVEKAHPDVFNVFLQVLDAGRLTDGAGRTVSFADAIIVMTTNIGQAHFLDEESWDSAVAMANAELDATYRSEFLNRFAGRQNILCFHKLGMESIELIVGREITSLDHVYAERGVRVAMDEMMLKIFCESRYDPRVGARGLPGYITAELEPIIVNKIIEVGELRAMTAQVGYDATARKFTVVWC